MRFIYVPVDFSHQQVDWFSGFNFKIDQKAQSGTCDVTASLCRSFEEIHVSPVV